MKFLVIMTPKDILFTLPPQKRLELMEGHTAYIDKYRKVGKCKESYCTLAAKSKVTIWDFESAEESAQLFLDDPMLPFWETETYALVESDVGTKAIKERLEKLI